MLYFNNRNVLYLYKWTIVRNALSVYYVKILKTHTTTHKGEPKNQNNDNSKIPTFILILSSLIILTPIITALLTLLIQYIKQKSRIKSSKTTRTLSLDNITVPFHINELRNVEKSKNFSYVPYVKWNKNVANIIVQHSLITNVAKSISSLMKNLIRVFSKWINPVIYQIQSKYSGNWKM